MFAMIDVSPPTGQSEALLRAVVAKSGAKKRKRVNIVGDMLRLCSRFSG